jgi:hypothetical protein
MYDACEITFQPKYPLKMGKMICSLPKPRRHLGRELFPCLWKRRRGLPLLWRMCCDAWCCDACVVTQVVVTHVATPLKFNHAFYYRRKNQKPIFWNPSETTTTVFHFFFSEKNVFTFQMLSTLLDKIFNWNNFYNGVNAFVVFKNGKSFPRNFL